MKRAALFILAFTLCASAHAERGDRRQERHWHGDIRQFHDRDFPRWRSGRWYHGGHDGRLGWWWIVGPLWYFYPGPIYPYPNPYVPPVIMQAPPAARYWYYCASSGQYYPYVAVCPEGWRMVPADPVPR